MTLRLIRDPWMSKQNGIFTNAFWITALSSLALFVAVLPMPGWYYTLLKWFLFVGNLYSAYHAWAREKGMWGTIAIVTAYCWRPIFPERFSRVEWLPVNLFMAVTFALLAWHIRRITPKAGFAYRRE